mgnify:FL=1
MDEQVKETTLEELNETALDELSNNKGEDE